MSLLNLHSSLYRTGDISESLFTTGLTYSSGRNGYIYQPPGYDDNSNDYPLIIFLHGDGARSSTVTDIIAGSDSVNNEGTGWFLNQGDEPSGVLIALPQLPFLSANNDFLATDFDDVMTFMTSNYRVNINRIYVTGLSRGAFGTRHCLQDRASQVAGSVLVCGNVDTGWNWSGTTGDGQSDIGHFWINGTNDSTVTNGQLTILAGANSSAFNRNIPVDTLSIHNGDHNGAVWNTYCYNRSERTDASGSAPFDYVRYLKRFSKDQTERATLHVEHAEYTLNINDWRLARVQVDVMTGATKSILLTRLATTKILICRLYCHLWKPAATVTTGTSIYYCNNQSTHTAGASISNLIDDENGSSSIGFTIVNQFASSGREGSISSNRNRGRYFGYERTHNTDGMTISTSVTGGTCKFTGLNNAKLYDIRIFHSTASSFATNATIRTTINGVVKTQYSECNNTLYVEYLNISPTSSEIAIAIRTDADKSLFVTGFELYQHA